MLRGGLRVLLFTITLQKARADIMTEKTLYRYTREDGGVTVSPKMPDVEYTTLTRIIADKGKLLTKDGENTYKCVDIDNVAEWYEVDSEEEATEEDYIEALGRLGVTE